MLGAARVPGQAPFLVGWRACRITTRSCCCPSAGPRDRTTSSRSLRTSPGAAACPRSASPRWPGTTTPCGGVSPINAQCRDMLGAIGAALRSGGIGLPLYWGNRNWHPFVDDTVRQMRDDGVRRAIAFVTSAYSSYSACRQYLDDIDRAVAGKPAATGRGPPVRPGTADRQDPPVLQPPGLHRAVRRRRGGRPWPGCPPRPRPAPGWCSPRTASPSAWPPRAAARRRAPRSPAPRRRYEAELREASRLITERVRGGPFPPISSSRAGAARRACPGSNRT